MLEYNSKPKHKSCNHCHYMCVSSVHTQIACGAHQKWKNEQERRLLQNQKWTRKKTPAKSDNEVRRKQRIDRTWMENEKRVQSQTSEYSNISNGTIGKQSVQCIHSHSYNFLTWLNRYQSRIDWMYWPIAEEEEKIYAKIAYKMNAYKLVICAIRRFCSNHMQCGYNLYGASPV